MQLACISNATYWKASLTLGWFRGLFCTAWAFLSQCCHPDLVGLFMHCFFNSLAAGL